MPFVETTFSTFKLLFPGTTATWHGSIHFSIWTHLCYIRMCINLTYFSRIF